MINKNKRVHLNRNKWHDVILIRIYIIIFHWSNWGSLIRNINGTKSAEDADVNASDDEFGWTLLFISVWSMGLIILRRLFDACNTGCVSHMIVSILFTLVSSFNLRRFFDGGSQSLHVNFFPSSKQHLWTPFEPQHVHNSNKYPSFSS